MNFLCEDLQEPTKLSGLKHLPERCHLFDLNSIRAVNAALAARRPLLLVGEPGVGKSQLARAVAKRLGRAFVSTVIDAQTESRDLLYSVDAVQRLADAQIKAAIAVANKQSADELEQALSLSNYIRPGPMWWAFNWLSAKGCQLAPVSPQPQEDDIDLEACPGAVLLIDEIDKGQPELPNGLLEALGDGCFGVPGFEDPIQMSTPSPLIVITSNDERDLPAAFIRRCLVFRMTLPKDKELKAYLCRLGAAHQPDLHKDILDEAANQLISDRGHIQRSGGQMFPGLAEYLDMLRALQALYPKDYAAQIEALEEIARFTSGKHMQLQAVNV